jgi:hypothetical protein
MKKKIPTFKSDEDAADSDMETLIEYDTARQLASADGSGPV